MIVCRYAMYVEPPTIVQRVSSTRFQVASSVGGRPPTAVRIRTKLRIFLSSRAFILKKCTNGMQTDHTANKIEGRAGTHFGQAVAGVGRAAAALPGAAAAQGSTCMWSLRCTM